MAAVFAALLRHAEYRQLEHTPSAHQPFPLTEAGVRQASAAGQQLLADAARLQWRIAPEIHCSGLLRAWQTARLIADELGEGVILGEYPDLAERSVGSVANLTVQQIETIVREDPRYAELPPDWKSSSEYCLPFIGAESLRQAGKRVAVHLCSVMQRLESVVDEDTLQIFVGHGAAIRHAVHELGVLEAAEVSRLSMYHAEPVYLQYREAGWKQVGGRWKPRESRARPD